MMDYKVGGGEELYGGGGLQGGAGGDEFLSLDGGGDGVWQYISVKIAQGWSFS